MKINTIATLGVLLHGISSRFLLPANTPND